EDGIRDRNVTGVQTCALPICLLCSGSLFARPQSQSLHQCFSAFHVSLRQEQLQLFPFLFLLYLELLQHFRQYLHTVSAYFQYQYSLKNRVVERYLILSQAARYEYVLLPLGQYELLIKNPLLEQEFREMLLHQNSPVLKLPLINLQKTLYNNQM